jgi:prepilin-type N-terminal cleavage/methylation domain-containing protein
MSPDNARKSALAGRGRAFTLVELLISVAILTIIILAVGSVAVQARRVVTRGQATIRLNQAASAVSRTVRDDAWTMSQQGFLCITQTSEGSPPVLLMSTAGPIQSKTHPEIGLATVSIYGMGFDVQPTPEVGSQPNMLYRQAWVLEKPEGSISGPTDIWAGQDLGDIQILPRHHADELDLDSLITALVNSAPSTDLDNKGSAIRLPAQSFTDVRALWQVLAPRCKALSVMWTDTHTKTYGMQWRGIGYAVDSSGRVSYYLQQPQSKTWHDKKAADDTTEYNLDETGASRVYRALWSNHRPDDWPVMIKFRFLLVADEPSLPPEQREVDFEVICTVGLMG